MREPESPEGTLELARRWGQKRRGLLEAAIVLLLLLAAGALLALGLMHAQGRGECGRPAAAGSGHGTGTGGRTGRRCCSGFCSALQGPTCRPAWDSVGSLGGGFLQSVFPGILPPPAADPAPWIFHSCMPRVAPSKGSNSAPEREGRGGELPTALDPPRSDRG